MCIRNRVYSKLQKRKCELTKNKAKTERPFKRRRQASLLHYHISVFAKCQIDFAYGRWGDIKIAIAI
jgi:hypothetical protein